MDNVIAVYGDEDGDTLREYTHLERPWRETRGDWRMVKAIIRRYRISL